MLYAIADRAGAKALAIGKKAQDDKPRMLLSSLAKRENARRRLMSGFVRGQVLGGTHEKTAQPHKSMGSDPMERGSMAKDSLFESGKNQLSELSPEKHDTGRRKHKTSKSKESKVTTESKDINNEAKEVGNEQISNESKERSEESKVHGESRKSKKAHKKESKEKPKKFKKSKKSKERSKERSKKKLKGECEEGSMENEQPREFTSNSNPKGSRNEHLQSRDLEQGAMTTKYSKSQNSISEEQESQDGATFGGESIKSSSSTNGDDAKTKGRKEERKSKNVPKSKEERDTIHTVQDYATDTHKRAAAEKDEPARKRQRDK